MTARAGPIPDARRVAESGQIMKNASGIQENCWQPQRKLLASCGVAFKPLRSWDSDDNEARMADRLADRTIAWLSTA